LQLLSGGRSEHYQDFICLTKKEATRIDKLCRKGPVPIRKLRSYIIESAKNDDRGLLRLRRMLPDIAGHPVHYVVSLVSNPQGCTSIDLSVFAVTPSGKPYIWFEQLVNVRYDFELKIGFPIGYFFVSNLKRFVTMVMLSLLAIYLKGEALSAIRLLILAHCL